MPAKGTAADNNRRHRPKWLHAAVLTYVTTRMSRVYVARVVRRLTVVSAGYMARMVRRLTMVSRMCPTWFVVGRRHMARMVARIGSVPMLEPMAKLRLNAGTGHAQAHKTRRQVHQ
jgi:hypothetical protein